MNQKFSIKETIEFGWGVARKNIWFFVLLLISILAIHSLVYLFWNGALFTFLSLFGGALDFFGAVGVILALPFLILIPSLLLQLLFNLGLIKICLRFCDNEKPRFSELFSQYPLLLRYLFAGIFYKFLILFGLILFIIPGIIFAIRFSFYDYFIVDKKSNIIEALKRSWQITEGNTINLFLLYLFFILINVLGALALFIGLFWTIPTTMVAKAFVYRKLLSFFESQKV